MFSKNVIGLCDLYTSRDLGVLSEPHRSPSATSFLGRYALIDFPLSNFVNSGIDVVGIVIKDRIRSVLNHIGSGQTWTENTKIGKETIMINELGITHPSTNTDITNLNINHWVKYSNADYVVIQPAHILTNIELRPVVKSHIESGKDVTVVYKRINDADETFTHEYVFDIQNNEIIEAHRNDSSKKRANVSLGIIVIAKSFLIELVETYKNSNLCLSDVLASLTGKSLSTNAYEHKGSARCFDSLEHYYQYSLEILDKDAANEMFDPEWPIYTTTHDTPPAQYGDEAEVRNAYIANGCLVNGNVDSSILSRSVIIKKGATVKNSVLLGGVVVEEGAYVENCVIDKHTIIGKNKRLVGSKNKPVYIGKKGRI